MRLLNSPMRISINSIRGSVIVDDEPERTANQHLPINIPLRGTVMVDGTLSAAYALTNTTVGETYPIADADIPNIHAYLRVGRESRNQRAFLEGIAVVRTYKR